MDFAGKSNPSSVPKIIMTLASTYQNIFWCHELILLLSLRRARQNRANMVTLD